MLGDNGHPLLSSWGRTHLYLIHGPPEEFPHRAFACRRVAARLRWTTFPWFLVRRPTTATGSGRAADTYALRLPCTHHPHSWPCPSRSGHLPERPHSPPPPDPPVPGDGVMTMTLTGDAIITRALSPYVEPAYLEMIDLLRSADMAFTNLEVLLHDYEPYPAYQSGGTWMRAAPEMAEELVWAGFDMVSLANNHTGDYGPLGGRLTRQYARAAGLVGAGSGEDLNEAREAKFLETADGRVALISLASTFTGALGSGPTGCSDGWASRTQPPAARALARG